MGIAQLHHHRAGTRPWPWPAGQHCWGQVDRGARGQHRETNRTIPPLSFLPKFPEIARYVSRPHLDEERMPECKQTRPHKADSAVSVLARPLAGKKPLTLARIVAVKYPESVIVSSDVLQPFDPWDHPIDHAVPHGPPKANRKAFKIALKITRTLEDKV
eukprot:8298274-Pyramimonas_sp.AAC.1